MADRGRRSVLIVEDNPAALKLFRIILESEGYEVRGAGSARRGLEAAMQTLPDLVLQDLQLPDMEGLELLRALRALPGADTLPIIAISGFRALLERAAGEPHAFDATLLKPVESSQLLELVRGYLPLPAEAVDRFGSGKSVLVIDDDPIQLKLIRLRLQHLGFDVRVADTGASALEQAQNQPPDVVLCDVLMPENDGYELCQALRSLPALKQVPVVLVSAYYGGALDEKLAHRVGAAALVVRTPELVEVVAALRQALASGATPSTTAPGQAPQLPRQEHLERVRAQLERQTVTNAGVAARSALQAAQLSILAGIAESLVRSQDIEAAFADILVACLDAGGISRGALYRIGERDELVLSQALGFPDGALEALGRAFGCSEPIVRAGHGVVVPASECLSKADSHTFFSTAGLNAAVFVPFLEGERCIGALLLGSSVASSPPEVSELDLMVFARAIGAQISQALALSESFSRLRDAAEMGRVLSESLDLEETLAALARLATARLADVCEIDLVDEEPRVFTSGRTGDPTLGRRLSELRRAYPRFPRTSGGASGFPASPELVPTISDERLRQSATTAEHLALLQALGLKTELVVPLRARGRVLGVVSLARVRTGRAFSERDLIVAEDLVSRAAIAIDNASLYRVAQSASRMKDEFLTTVSHELRTPLTAILGWARMLVGGLDPSKRENAYRVIERNAKAQARLIEDLLDTSRITAGQMRIELQPTDIGRVIDLAVESIEPALTLKNIQLRRSAEREAISIRGDAARLQQVIWNLLLNAVKFTPSGGHVDVAARVSEGRVVVTVSDDGQGIAPDFIDLVFDRFKQAEGSITRAQGGLGLGLAISRHLVELHGGSISVHSDGKGRGSTFTVELPLVDPRLAASAAGEHESNPDPPEPAGELANVAILVVDDDADTRELLIEALHGCGARARGAASAEEAFGVVARERPDILLSDIGMPGEDGYTLIRRIRTLPHTQGGTIPAAAITAYTRAEDRSLAIDAGFQIHLAKPVSPSALIEAAVRLAKMASAARQH